VAQLGAQVHVDRTRVAHKHLAAEIPNPERAAWAAHLVPTVAIAAVTAWLDAGQPDPDRPPTASARPSTASSTAAQRP
jgi:hypothetical protein